MDHIAIDLGGRESQVCIRNSEGKILEEKRYATRELGAFLAERPKSRVANVKLDFAVPGRKRMTSAHTSNSLEGFHVREILRPSRRALVRNQIIEPDHAAPHVSERPLDPARPRVRESNA